MIKNKGLMWSGRKRQAAASLPGVKSSTACQVFFFFFFFFQEKLSKHTLSSKLYVCVLSEYENVNNIGIKYV